MAAIVPPVPALFGPEGELISVSITVEPKMLESLLEALAVLNFPVNPQLYHRPARVTVEFPIYSTQLGKVRDQLACDSFPTGDLHVSWPSSGTKSA
jgi:hypothetical protein